MRRFKVFATCGCRGVTPHWKIVEFEDEETEDDIQETLDEIAQDMKDQYFSAWAEEIK